MRWLRSAFPNSRGTDTRTVQGPERITNVFSSEMFLLIPLIFNKKYFMSAEHTHKFHFRLFLIRC